MKVTFVALLCCAAIASAKDTGKVRIAWTRVLTNAGVTIMPDHLGHIAAVGNDLNSAVALIIDKHGRPIASGRVPVTNFLAYGTTDHSGRVFVAAGDYASSSVQSYAFAPLLSTMLWSESRSLSNFFLRGPEYPEIAALAADETGGVFVYGDWYRNYFLSQLRGDYSGAQVLWTGWSDARYENSAAIARAPNGDIFGVGTTFTLPKYPWISVLKYSPSTGEVTNYDRLTLLDGYISIARDAVCDAAGNLIIVGQESEDGGSLFVGDRRCLTIKLDSQLNLLWRRFYGPFDGSYSAYAVAVDAADNIIMTGNAGTVKYSSAGEILWTAPEWGNQLRLNSSGEILLVRSVTLNDHPYDGVYETEVSKLDADGRRRWQVHVLEGPQYNFLGGLIAGDDGDYVATRKGADTTILKFVEHGHANGRQKNRVINPGGGEE